MKRGRLSIGTSGWSYSHWANGIFYPRGLKQGEWLSFFSRHFDTVEVNSSFYRLPKPEIILHWAQVTGARFRFAVKLWRRITHDKQLAGCAAELQDFFAVVNGLGAKRAPLLVQLPPSMHRDTDRLAQFLTEVRQAARPRRWRVAVEFRNPDWLGNDVFHVLSQHAAALVLADMPRCPVTEPNDAPFIYMRRHGPGGRYRGCYTKEHLTADATCIRQWLEEGRDVYVYFNNDIEGHALSNARLLRDIVSC
ncbi:MAG: DUF72 domain-containing protein [Planctomycetota bacterium]